MKSTNEIFERLRIKHEKSLSPNDLAFCSRNFVEGLEKYTKRLQQIDFQGAEYFVDAGCGFGQWALAAADLNKQVYAFDCAKNRIDFLGDYVEEAGISNIKVATGTLEDIPCSDEIADLVFSYGVIFISDWKKSLNELARITKKGGKIYLTANGFGWYQHMWLNRYNEVEDFDPREFVADVLRNTLDYEKKGTLKPAIGVIIDQSELKEEMAKNKLRIIEMAPEGEIALTETKGQPFFQGEYNGVLGAYELVAEKL